MVVIKPTFTTAAAFRNAADTIDKAIAEHYPVKEKNNG